jgi:OOP family OmpA-OmpF porin
VTTFTSTLERLLYPASSDAGIDREALAGLLTELARSIEPESAGRFSGVTPIDPRLEQLRALLVGREIEILKRLSEIVEDPEQLALTVSRILPTAVAHASSDERLGQVLAPTVEKATQTSIHSNPRTLINILYPLIVPAMRKSVGEMIDETFQSLNESLKHIFTWQGLKWRWEAWRAGTSFGAVVLKHSLIYQVEHVFLIHQHTGLLIAHVAAPNAVSQDPQVVSSMLVAIQDFVKDSFSGTEQRSLDTLMLGELRLWSERGPFATLVTVIRGNPPESLHETLANVLAKIHAERPQALENFDGDSSGFADVEALMTDCVTLRQAASTAPKKEFPWLVVATALGVAAILGIWSLVRWHNESLWEGYVARLRDQPGIVVAEAVRRGGKFQITGLRDPLAVDPAMLMREAKVNPSNVITHWAPYQSLDVEFVMKRLQAALDPPRTLTFAVDGNHIVVRGSAPAAWLDRARLAVRMLPAGAPNVDLFGVSGFTDGAIGKLSEAIQSQEILFDHNGSLPAAGQQAVLDLVASDVRELALVASKLRIMVHVALVGHSDAAGQGTFNLFLSVARAEAVRSLLKQRGVDPSLLTVRGAGPLEPRESEISEAARSRNRRVSFTVEVGEL